PTTDSAAASSSTHTQTTSAPRTACARSLSITTPAAATSVNGRTVRFHPRTAKPARARLIAIGRPMAPNPRKATGLVISNSLQQSWFGAGRARHIGILPRRLESESPGQAACGRTGVARGWQRAESIFPWLVTVRRATHRHPELAYQEARTAQLIRTELARLGISYRCD